MSTDEKALKAAIEILGKHDTHYSEWSLDEGHLRSFIADYEAAKASGQPREWETPQSTHEGPCVGYRLNAEGKFICEQCSAAKLQPVDCRAAYDKWALLNGYSQTGHPEADRAWQAYQSAWFTKRESLVWQRGFPTEGGMYLVELADGEMVVTPWNDGTGKNRDSWGDERRAGWGCLTDSRSTVQRWIKASTLAALPTNESEDAK